MKFAVGDRVEVVPGDKFKDGINFLNGIIVQVPESVYEDYGVRLLDGNCTKGYQIDRIRAIPKCPFSIGDEVAYMGRDNDPVCTVGAIDYTNENDEKVYAWMILVVPACLNKDSGVWYMAKHYRKRLLHLGRAYYV